MRDDATDRVQSEADEDQSAGDAGTRGSLGTGNPRSEPAIGSQAPELFGVATTPAQRPDRRSARSADGRSGGSSSGSPSPAAETVSLVGSGPGDPELLTRRAWNRLTDADVVMHDSLTGDDIVAQLPESVEVLDVGKRPPDRTTQEEINELLFERSTAGERVVRLKGGDPNVFGRGGEEAEFLAARDVPFEVVPGISSVLAAPSVSGVPLTHRDCSSSVTAITGHQTPDKAESALDWDGLAATVRAGGTLVVLMGVRRLPENVRALRSHGVAGDTPVAMVEKATWEDERTVVGTLDTIVEKRESAEIESPATTIIGEVVEVRDAVKEALR